MGKRFFLELASWHLTTSLWINLFTDNFQGFWARYNFSRVACYSLKFTRCEILSLLVVEVARYAESLVTHFRSCSLQKNHSLLVAKFACYSLKMLLVANNYLLLVGKFARYSLQKLFVAKNYSLLVAKFVCYSLQKFLVAKNQPSLVEKIRGVTFHSLLITFWNSLVARYWL